MPVAEHPSNGSDAVILRGRFPVSSDAAGSCSDSGRLCTVIRGRFPDAVDPVATTTTRPAPLGGLGPNWLAEAAASAEAVLRSIPFEHLGPAGRRLIESLDRHPRPKH
jgi:hypothetical protein